jgi:hypothetical protein
MAVSSALGAGLRAWILCLAVLSLAACGGSQPALNSPWQQPASYDPPGPPSDPWGPYIRQASQRFDVPELWIREVMRQESAFRPNATSRAGAMGLMQVMPGTYRELQARHGLGPDPYHPWNSVMAGTAYLRQMYELYGNPGFLAAYNAGPRRFEDYLWAGRGLPGETRHYVARIGPRIVGAAPARRAPPEIYAAAEVPTDIPPGPRRGNPATMVALRDQRAPLPPIRDASPSLQMARLSLGTVVAVTPAPTGPTPPPSAGPPRTAMAARASTPGRPLVASAQAGTLPAPEPRVARPGSLPPPGRPAAQPDPPRAMLAAAAPPRLSLVGSAQAATLPPPAVTSPGRTSPAGAWSVQVGAFASENLARAAANQARDRVTAVGARPAVVPVRQGRDTLYRAMITGLSRDAAMRACPRSGGPAGCAVVSPQG